jgi:glycosyltransferase involved in cell wall biosynthesis
VDVCSQVKRIDVVVRGVPSQSIGASRVIFFQYIKSLVETGYKVRCIIFLSCGQESDYALFCKEIEKTGPISVCFIQCQVPIISSGRFSVRVDESLSFRFRTLLFEDIADLLLLLDISVAAIAPRDFPNQKIVWVGDLGSEVNWYDGILVLKRNFALGFIKMISVLVRGYFWKKIYKSSLKSADRIVACSYSSIKPLKRIGIDAMFLPYPWPSQGRLDVDIRRKEPEKPTFLMFGNLKGLGWRSQWDFLFNDLLPKLRETFGNQGFKIDIGGIEDAPSWLVSRLMPIEEIEFHGFIPNLLEQMSKSHAVIVPLGVPVGNRSRIITALGGRIPVIAHKNAAAGNPLLINGLNCLLADSAQEFVHHMSTISRDKKLSKRLIENAEISYVSSFSPRNANQLFLNLINAQLYE